MVLRRPQMKTRKKIFQTAIVGFLLVVATNARALTLAKDTVYESKFSVSDPTWSIWNDVVYLINSTTDTLRIEAIYFSVPPGKYAQISVGFWHPYFEDGPVSGIVIDDRQPYVTLSEQDRTMYPHVRVPISGIKVERCINCPVAQGGSATIAMDTLVMHLIFETKQSLDTLVVIGDIQSVSTGTIPQPFGQASKGIREYKYRPYHLFNILGRDLPF